MNVCITPYPADRPFCQPTPYTPNMAAIGTCFCEEANRLVASPSRTKSYPEVRDKCCYSSWTFKIAYDKYFLFILLLVLTTPSRKRGTNPELHPQNRFRYRHRQVQCRGSKQAARPANS